MSQSAKTQLENELSKCLRIWLYMITVYVFQYFPESGSTPLLPLLPLLLTS